MKKAVPFSSSMSIAVALVLTLVMVGLLAASCAPEPPPFVPPPPARQVEERPRVKISNDYNQEMVFGVDGPQRRVVTLPASSTQVIHLKPGVYKYAAAAKGTQAVTGFKAFYRHHSYQLKFGVNQTQAD